MSTPVLKLKGFTFNELFDSAGLLRLDQNFLRELAQEDQGLHAQLLAYRQGTPFPALQLSEFLLALAPKLETFLARLFAIEEAVSISQAKTTQYNPVAAFKKYFVLRRAKKEVLKVANFPSFDVLTTWLDLALQQAALQTQDQELAVSLLGLGYLQDPEKNAEAIEKLVQWCTQALCDGAGQAYVKGWQSFKIPQRLDYENLVPTKVATQDAQKRLRSASEDLSLRDGFKLTDERMDQASVQNEVNYCIYCHDHDGDFCSKGFPVKKGDRAQGFKKNPLEVILTGCPLEEKISEMNLLKRDGYTLAALAMVMIDNPMCPATGHRICNDCMKACIYQKQDPVNIPQIETRVLTDVLALPWGVEIYDLLTRWNPLRATQWVMKPYNGLKIMIAGMGPAGFTLAHHLLLEGFAVLGFDGLKIEPLPTPLIQQPIYDFNILKESLAERLMAGFGGVAEYGITVRWDKNFLKLIYLSLLRKPTFQVFGGVRFGGTVQVEDAWELGFAHFVVAVGAGLPKALPIPNSLAKGMRQANEFLMSLQLGNAAKASSLTNLQIRLPAVVIGGGLTGVDTATEVQAYYIALVEKIYKRHQMLCTELGEEAVLAAIPPESREILVEYLQHGALVIKEREKAHSENRPVNFTKLLHAWGGVTIVYRRSMQESPAYINNHEELQKALQEGIFYLEGLEPRAVILNDHGFTESLVCHKRIRNEAKTWVATQEEVRLPARAILVATGTQPNTAYEFEHKGTFNRLNLQYQHYEQQQDKTELQVAHGVLHCKDPEFGAFTSYKKQDHRVSLIGDTHPVFHGSVVKAIASGMRTYPKILALLHDQLTTGDMAEYEKFAAHMRDIFSARVTSVKRKAQDVLEVNIKAPLAAKHFQPGQFYRLQNYETYAKRITDTLLQMEPLALVPAHCDKQAGILSFLIHEHDATTKICRLLEMHEPVSLMGPTGVRAKIPTQHETVMIIGDKTSVAFTRSYATALRARGNRIIYVGYYADKHEVYAQAEIEAVSDVCVWLTRAAEIVVTKRVQDKSSQASNLAQA